jgi:hypothetical protein
MARRLDFRYYQRLCTGQRCNAFLQRNRHAQPRDAVDDQNHLQLSQSQNLIYDWIQNLQLGHPVTKINTTLTYDTKK